MSTQFVKNISISNYSVYSISYIYQLSLVYVQFQCQKTVQFQIIQFSISTQFKCKYGFMVKNISISTIQFSLSIPSVLFNP